MEYVLYFFQLYIHFPHKGRYYLNQKLWTILVIFYVSLIAYIFFYIVLLALNIRAARTIRKYQKHKLDSWQLILKKTICNISFVSVLFCILLLILIISFPDSTSLFSSTGNKRLLLFCILFPENGLVIGLSLTNLLLLSSMLHRIKE